MSLSNTDDELLWSGILQCAPDLKTWNANLGELKGLAEQYGPECKKFIAAEAERRGYQWCSAERRYKFQWKMFATKGRNVIAVGWQEGTLRVAFSSKKFWRYEGVPEDEFEKLRKVPFPDKIFHANIKSKDYKATAE